MTRFWARENATTKGNTGPSNFVTVKLVASAIDIVSMRVFYSLS